MIQNIPVCLPFNPQSVLRHTLSGPWLQQTPLVIILETFKQDTYRTELTASHKSGQQNPNIALTGSNMHGLSWIPEFQRRIHNSPATNLLSCLAETNGKLFDFVKHEFKPV
jgi:hypothetical protein